MISDSVEIAPFADMEMLVVYAGDVQGLSEKAIPNTLYRLGVKGHQGIPLGAGARVDTSWT